MNKITLILFFAFCQNLLFANHSTSDTDELEIRFIKRSSKTVEKVNLNYRVKLYVKDNPEPIRGKAEIISIDTIKVDSTIVSVNQIQKFSCTIGKGHDIASIGVGLGAVGLAGGAFIFLEGVNQLGAGGLSAVALGALTVIVSAPALLFGGVYNISSKKHYNSRDYQMVITSISTKRGEELVTQI